MFSELKSPGARSSPFLDLESIQERAACPGSEGVAEDAAKYQELSLVLARLAEASRAPGRTTV